jgi:hypothetical protein
LLGLLEEARKNPSANHAPRLSSLTSSDPVLYFLFLAFHVE